jgi:hypothetical protein
VEEKNERLSILEQCFLIMHSKNGTGHSADVRIELLLNGKVPRLAQLGPDFLVLDHPAKYPAGTADILMSVDGEAERWTIRLPDGIQPARSKVPISSV